jgi:hypothetical protein
MSEPKNIDNSFRKAFYHLKMAEYYYEDTVREDTQSIAGKFAKKCVEKIKWLLMEFKTHPMLPRYAMDDWQKELDGDIMFHEAISRKCMLLSDKQKAAMESALDCLISGEKLTLVLNENYNEKQ